LSHATRLGWLRQIPARLSYIEGELTRPRCGFYSLGLTALKELTHTSSRLLEFDSLCELLRGYAWSPLGQARVAQLAPAQDREWIEQQQQLTAEIRRYLAGGSRFEFSGLADVRELVKKSRIEGAALETLEIRDLLAAVDRAAEWREIALQPPQHVQKRAALGPSVHAPQHVRSAAAHPSPKSGERAGQPGEGSAWPAVEALSRGITDFTELLRFFRKKISPDGTLDDRASPELGAIRREVE